jgi:hypothetical protein
MDNMDRIRMTTGNTNGLNNNDDDGRLSGTSTHQADAAIKLFNKKYMDATPVGHMDVDHTKTGNQGHDKVPTTSKQRHLSSNSLGENCDAQELPLIGYPSSISLSSLPIRN